LLQTNTFIDFKITSLKKTFHQILKGKTNVPRNMFHNLIRVELSFAQRILYARRKVCELSIAKEQMIYRKYVIRASNNRSAQDQTFLENFELEFSIKSSLIYMWNEYIREQEAAPDEEVAWPNADERARVQK